MCVGGRREWFGQTDKERESKIERAKKERETERETAGERENKRERREGEEGAGKEAALSATYYRGRRGKVSTMHQQRVPSIVQQQ